MALEEEINITRKEIRTDGYSMSIGEWISLYESEEIDIHPEFQRFFRWTAIQKTRLVESILLGIPIPQIFVSQRKDGVWDVVDGLQRLSTIYQFVGILKNEDGVRLPPLVLEKTKYLPSLQNINWDEEGSISLTSSQRLLIKRTKIAVSIILKESDENSKYELFQRLNTGGSALSPQEVRNSILVMINREVYQWMKLLSSNEAYREVLALTDRANDEQYDLDLLLRFIIFRIIPQSQLSNIGDMGEFLTDKMVDMVQNKKLDLAEETLAFEATFNLLRDVMGSDSFRKYDVEKDRFLGGFLVSAFESIALGLGFDYKTSTAVDSSVLRDKIKTVWQDPEFIRNSGSGIRASSRVPHTVAVGRKVFA